MAMQFPTPPVMEDTDNLSTPLVGMARLRAELAHHGVLIFIVAAYCIVAGFYLSAHGLMAMPLFDEYFIATSIPILAVVSFRLFGETAYHALHVRPFLWGGLYRGILTSELVSKERITAAAVPVLLIPFFSSIFTTLKVSIPVLAPFSWDPMLSHYDQVLHGGIQPWEILQSILGHPLITSVISYLYNIWHGMWVVVYWQIFRVRDRELRMHFLLAFVMSWIILGSGGALLFSSAGPCYYGHVVTGPNPYAEQMAYLNQGHEHFLNWSLLAQDYLWNLYTSGNAHLGGGISAMPSLHVAVAVLLFLLARANGHRLLTRIAGGYAMVVLIGSVHLGWHYALDGYVAAISAVVIWFVAGWLVRHVVVPAPRSGELT